MEKFKVRITHRRVPGRYRHLGPFDTVEEAKDAVDAFLRGERGETRRDGEVCRVREATATYIIHIQAVEVES